jgi:hypothetical protein
MKLKTQTISHIHVCEAHKLIRKPYFDRDERERVWVFGVETFGALN